MIHGCKTIFFFIYIDESSQKWLKVVCKKYRNLTKNVCDLTAEHGDMQRQLIISLVKYGIMGKYCQCWIHILKDDWFILFISIVWSFIFSSPVWAIAITWRLASVCKLFQKSSPLKPLGQFKPNLAWIILRGFPLKFMSDDRADQPSWPPCL